MNKLSGPFVRGRKCGAESVVRSSAFRRSPSDRVNAELQASRETAAGLFGSARKPAVISALVALLLLVGWSASAQTTRIITSSNANFATLQSNVNLGGNIFLNFNGTLSMTGTITVSTSSTLFTTGTNLVALTGAGSNRLFQVKPGVTLTLSNLTLSGGNHVGATGANGAAGTTGNGGSTGNTGGSGASGGPGIGGAIFNQGNTIAYFCLFLTNSATGGTGGAGGVGGAGTSTIGAGGAGGNGGAALGAAIFNAGTLQLFGCTFSGNSAVAGSGGLGAVGATNVFNITGAAGNGGSGGIAAGAGLYTSNSCSATIEACSFIFNFCESGSSQAAGGPNSNGSGIAGAAGPLAAGGGVCNLGTNILVNCTFDQNLAVGGTGGNGGIGGNAGSGGNGGNGGNAIGGSLYNTNGALTQITNCTFASGECFGGTNGVGGTGSHNSGNNGSVGSSLGANIANAGGTLLLKNSILAYPTNALNASGTITDQNNNISTDTSANFTQANSSQNTNPDLDDLADNGGPTLTLALEQGSPAIDKIFDATGWPAVDQRGNARPFGLHPDIGAFEFGTSTFSITGTITTTNGAGVANVTVDASGVADTVTAADGTYTIDGLTAGSYVITPTLTNFTFSPASLPVTAPTNGVNFTATATPFAITGVVRLASNGPLYTNVTLQATNASLTNLFTATTGTNGAYVFTNLPAGTYVVTPQPSGVFVPTNALIVLATTNGIQNFFGRSTTITLTSSSALQGVTLSLAVLPHVTYRIQASTNLSTNVSSWQDISTNATGTNAGITFFSSTNGFPRRFFRAVTP